MLVVATGHRPEALGSSYTLPRLRTFARLELEKTGAHWLISGMARGWDTAVALAALDLGIPFIAAVPFKAQASRWSPADRAIYDSLLEAAQTVTIVCAHDLIVAYRKRDYWMIDQEPGLVLALYNGNPKTGTGITVAYAATKRREIINTWPGWLDYCRQN